MGLATVVSGHLHRWRLLLWKNHFDASPSTATLVQPARRCTARTGPSSARTAAWSTARTSPSLTWTSSSAKSSKKDTTLLHTKDTISVWISRKSFPSYLGFTFQFAIDCLNHLAVVSRQKRIFYLLHLSFCRWLLVENCKHLELWFKEHKTENYFVSVSEHFKELN